MSLKQPVGQKRLTNIAVVRMKSGGKRFEIACYKNKVLDWRGGIEKDLNEVIQSDTIFVNVSKGEVANEQDIRKVFSTNSREDICRSILKHGDLQVSDRERELHLEELFRDIVQLVVQRCVMPASGRQLTPSAVECSLKKIGFSVRPDQSAKKQSLKAIESLCARMPASFARAKMRLRLGCPGHLRDEIYAFLHETDQLTIELEQKWPGSQPASGAAAAAEPAPAGPVAETPAARDDGAVDNGVAASAEVVSDDLDAHWEDLGSLDAPVVGDTACATDAGGSRGVESAADGGSEWVEFDFICDPAQFRELDRLATVTHAGKGVVLRIVTAATLGEPVAGAAAAAHAALSESQDVLPAATSESLVAKPSSSKSFKCSSCGIALENSAEYRAHCKSPWHNHNLKRKMKSLDPLSESEFAVLSLDQREFFCGAD